MQLGQKRLYATNLQKIKLYQWPDCIWLQSFIILWLVFYYSNVTHSGTWFLLRSSSPQTHHCFLKFVKKTILYLKDIQTIIIMMLANFLFLCKYSFFKYTFASKLNNSKTIMKKFVLILSVAAFIAAGFSSCKKCSTCTAYDSTGAQIITSGEFCGSKKDVEDTENSFKSIWEQGDATVTCE